MGLSPFRGHLTCCEWEAYGLLPSATCSMLVQPSPLPPGRYAVLGAFCWSCFPWPGFRGAGPRRSVCATRACRRPTARGSVDLLAVDPPAPLDGPSGHVASCCDHGEAPRIALGRLPGTSSRAQAAAWSREEAGSTNGRWKERSPTMRLPPSCARMRSKTPPGRLA